MNEKIVGLNFAEHLSNLFVSIYSCMLLWLLKAFCCSSRKSFLVLVVVLHQRKQSRGSRVGETRSDRIVLPAASLLCTAARCAPFAAHLKPRVRRDGPLVLAGAASSLIIA